MKTRRDRHCFAKKEDGTMKYYAVYGDDVIKVEKAVFDVLDRSYSKERYLERKDLRNRNVSIEQIAEELEVFELHGTMPAALCVSSAEDEYLMTAEEDKTISIMWEEIDRLPENEAELFLTYLNENKAVKELIKKNTVPKSTLYRRRKEIAEKLGERIRRRLDNE